jgi:DNA-binding protein YbaB
MKKRKVSVSLDADLVEELERDGEALSAQINDAIREAVERRRRRRLLGQMLDEMEQQDGPPDPELVEKYRELFSAV